MWRHHPQAARARELLDDGAIGDLRLVRACVRLHARADAGDVRLQARARRRRR